MGPPTPPPFASPLAAPSATLALDVVGGSLTGASHRRVDRNNQDAWAAACTPRGAVAVVTDGCSSGRHSEVGAQLGARWLVELGQALLARRAGATDASPYELAAALQSQLLARLDALARLGGPAALVQTVADHLLFSMVVALVTPRRWVVLVAGDGVAVADGVVTVVDAGAREAPAYLGYRLLLEADDAEGLSDCGRRSLAEALPREPRLEVVASGPTATLGTLVIGSDGCRPLLGATRAGAGAGALGALTADAALWRNPSLLQKRLRVLGRGTPLHDDVTAVMLQRRDRATAGGLR